MGGRGAAFSFFGERGAYKPRSYRLVLGHACWRGHEREYPLQLEKKMMKMVDPDVVQRETTPNAFVSLEGSRTTVSTEGYPM